MAISERRSHDQSDNHYACLENFLVQQVKDELEKKKKQARQKQIL